MARPKKYYINLTNNERLKLDKAIKNESTCKTVLKRCQILRNLDKEERTNLSMDRLHAVLPRKDV